jgi:hypothetical protein
MTNTRLLVLLYNKSWARSEEMPLPPCAGGCELTRDRARLAEADAVVFHVPSFDDWQQVRKRAGQLWVAASMESDVMYPQLRDPEFMARFDLTHTYQLGSDVPMLYFGPAELQALGRAPRPKTARAPIAAFVDNPRDAAGRFRYLSELMRYIAVDSFGSVLRNRTLARDTGRETKLDTIARYRFTLAIENSRTADYVTEKLFDPLIAGSVPLYLGAPNVEAFAPADECFIHVADFNGPRALADYLLELGRDPARYAAYLAWKQRPLRSRWVDLAMTQAEDPLCRLCRTLREIRDAAAAAPARRTAAGRGTALVVTRSAADRIAAGFVRELERRGVTVRDLDEHEADPREATAALHFSRPAHATRIDGLPNVHYTTTWDMPTAVGSLHTAPALLIVPTESCRELWLEAGAPADGIEVCAPGVDPPAPALEPLRLTTIGGEDIGRLPTRLLAVSEIEERKNLLGLLRVWIRNTDAGDRAVLIVRLTGATGQKAASLMFRLHQLERDLGKRLTHAAPVVFHDALLTVRQAPRIVAAATAYWSMSRGEAWDAAAVEASARGLRVIVPNHSF